MSLDILLLLALLPTTQTSLVETSYGLLEGVSIQARDNSPCWIFKGIPIAQPPVGNRRFKLPEPPKPWEGVRAAKQYSAACLSNSTAAGSQPKHMSEDCLYTNIFTSERCLSGNASCPVIFYIHGGSLNYDSAVMFDDQFITDKYSSKDIVFVISAFRLGFFGVLAFENDEVVPRNLALYDIIAGLEYMHHEIAAFGGDPKQVTLMGHSQGGSIAMIFAASSLIDPDKRLFQQLIALSPAVNYRSVDGRADLTWRLAHEVGCATSSKRHHPTTAVQAAEVVDCLRSVDAFDLLARQRVLEEEEGLPFDGVLFAPPLVEDGTAFEDFLSGSSARPMICGSTRYEFNFKDNDEEFDIGAFLVVKHPAEVRQKYFEDKQLGKITDVYLSQVVFTLNVMFGTVFADKGSHVYLLEYDQPPLAFHASDMPYFIGTHLRNLTEDEKLIDHFYSESFVNFAYGKQPNKEWAIFNHHARNYYCVEVNLEEAIFPSNKLNYHSAAVDYWLHNITAFDASLSTKVRLQIVETVSNPSFLRTVFSTLLFAVGFVVILTALMALCSYLTPQDPPLHERAPLIVSKKSVIRRKTASVVVPALTNFKRPHSHGEMPFEKFALCISDEQ
ncbi:Carboxylesterase [Ancylostoma ceylanicum]|uniref:Carboxylesterase n=1 Tax=Ancylostoma ceylanicum TaxID=53326 RepID=A0A0D6M0E3_9BILA|nr:Carboxylesterase [Ancylostoma ceylanicum]